MTRENLLRLDNIGIVVEDLKGAIVFFTELGLELEGEMTVEGEWVDRIVGIDGVKNDIAMMRTPDGHGKLELMKFLNPGAIANKTKPEVNTLGIRRIMFAVTNLDDVLARLEKRGAKRMGEVMPFGDKNGVGYRLCYIRGHEGIIIALAEPIGDKHASDAAKSQKSTLIRMDNVLIVLEDLEAAKSFFIELGMGLAGEMTVEGPAVEKLIGLDNVHATLSVMQMPDGYGGIELDKFHSPDSIRMESADAPVNTLGIRRIMFAVADIDDTLARLRARGAELVGEVVQYENAYRLCYIRGPEGIMIGLAEPLGL